MKQVTVIFEHDEDGWWVASAAEIKGCHTQGRSIAQARQRFGEALGLFVDHPEKVALVEDIRLPAAARRVVDASADARATAESVQRRAVE
jgi:predicted RNase H-like HicB family nuclease